jgi:hypothetical protein
MRLIVSLYVDASLGLVAVEDRQYHEGFLLVKEIDGLLEELGDQTSLTASQTANLPDLGVHDGRELDMLSLFDLIIFHISV